MVWLIPILVILTAYIEYWRIKTTFGKKLNINKTISVIIGIIIYSPVIFIWNLEAIIPTIAARGVFYDPALNLFRGLNIDYVSGTTNSVIDKIEKKIFGSFWIEKLFYLLIFILSIFLLKNICVFCLF